MTQEDWIGGLPQRKFKDIRNTRDNVAEEKARLCKQIDDVCNKLPEGYQSWSVNSVRDWKHTREAAMKTAGNKRATVTELSAALNSMSRFV